METPPFPARAGLLAGFVAGGWIGILDGLRAAFEGPEPFTGEDFGRGVLVQAAAGALLGLGAGRLLGRGGRRDARQVGILVTHGLAFLFLSLFLAGRFLPRQRATPSLVLNVLITACLVAIAALVLRRSARKFLARPPAPTMPRAAFLFAAAPVLALASFLLPSPPGVDPAPPAVRAPEGVRLPNVLVVVVDTLRADRVGACGSTLGLTPRMDALAREGTAFPRARTSSPWTKPSIASLLTGLRPERHGMQGMRTALPETAPTLLSHLDRAGYRTALLSDSLWTSPVFGFRRGVNGPFLHPETGDFRAVSAWRAAAFVRDWWVDSYHREDPSTQRGAPSLVKRLISWVGAHPGKPWAAYVHLMEPHHPYAPGGYGSGPRPRVPVQEFHGTVPYDVAPSLAAEDLAHMRSNYDDEVRAVDTAIGLLRDRLAETGEWENTLFVLAGDHGEEFHEHGGWVHEHSLHDELIRIPLLLRAPGGRGTGLVVGADVTLEDVLPTILDLCRIGSSARFDGRSLVPLLEGGLLPPRPSASVLHRSRAPIVLRSAVLGNLKVIRCRKAGDDRELWYDLATDPGESTPLPRPHAAVAAPLLEALAASEGLEALAAGRSTPLTPETEAALRAFGYLGDPAPGPK